MGRRRDKEDTFEDFPEDLKNDLDETEQTQDESTEEDLDDETEDLDEGLDSDDDILGGDDLPNNPMALANQISKESDTVKHFKDMPKETRFSFLNETDKVEIKHFARTYRNWNYIKKILDLRIQEDKEKQKAKLSIKEIETREDFKEYLEVTNREYLIRVLEDINDDDLSDLIRFIKEDVKENYFQNTIENQKEKMDTLFEEYREQSDTPSYIDDMDNLGKVVDTTVVSMGYKGNAAQHSVMTINAVKNEDIQKTAQEKSSFSFLDAIKRRFG